MHCWERILRWPSKDRLYLCLDRVLEHKQELFLWLRQKWADLFHADFEVLLDDLISTYFEAAMEPNPKAKYGHSRDQRTYCLPVLIALVITTDGFPLAYEVMDGNTSDRATLRGFLDKTEKIYGKGNRMWVMDRGIPSEETLREMRESAAKSSIWSELRKARSGSTKRSGWRDRHYLLRSNLTAGDPSVLCARYVQLTQIERVNSAYAPFTIHRNTAPTLTSRLPFPPTVCRSSSNIAYRSTLRG